MRGYVMSREQDLRNLQDLEEQFIWAYEEADNCD